MSPSTMIEVLIHKSTGTALAWPLDFTDREYFALRVTDENDLRFGAFEPDPVDELDGGPRYQPMRPRQHFQKLERVVCRFPEIPLATGATLPAELWFGLVEATENRAGRRNGGRKRRTFRDS